MNDYFLISLKQYANLVNLLDARRAALAVAAGLKLNMQPNQGQKFFAAIPLSGRPLDRVFQLRLTKKPKQLKTDLAEYVRVQLCLTDRVEAETVIGAYFRSVRELIEPAARLQLQSYIPSGLEHYLIRG